MKPSHYTISFVNCRDNPVVKDILQSTTIEAETAKEGLYHDFTFILTPEQINRALEAKKAMYDRWTKPNQYGHVSTTKEQAEHYYEEDKRVIMENGFGASKYKLPDGTLIWKHFKNHSKLIYTKEAQ